MINYQDREYKLPASLIPYYEKLCDIVFLNLYLREVRKEIQILNPCLYAPSGVGKTEIVLYLAKYFYADIVVNRIEKFLANNQDLKERLIRKLYPRGAIPKNLKEPENIVVVRLLLQTYLPDEILGVPRAVQVEIFTGETSHITRWTMPEWEEKVRTASREKPVILFLDELDKPTSDAVSAVLTLLSNRTIRDRELPDNVIIVGAMQNVPYDEAELIDDRTKEALFRRLYFIPIKDITIYVNTIRDFEIPISPDNELYDITQFGRKFKEAFGNIYKIDPIYPPGKSPREIAYLGNLLQALAEFKLIPTREMIEKYNRSIDEMDISDSEKQKMKIDLNELDKEKNVNNMFYLSSNEKTKKILGETVKGLHYYFSDFDKDKETRKICVLLYRTFVYEASGKREISDEDLDYFAKIERKDYSKAYLNSIRNLYTTLFSNNPLTFTRYLSYAILTTPYEIVKNELYNSNLNLYNFYLNRQMLFNKFLAEHILIYPTLYGFIDNNSNRERFKKILGKYESYVNMGFEKSLSEFPAFYILELFFFIFITNIILISSALIYEYIDKPNNRKEIEGKFSDFTFQIKLLLGEDIFSRLLKGTPNTISYYIGEEFNDNPDEIRKIFFENLFKFTDPKYIQQVKEEKSNWQVELLIPRGDVNLEKIRNEIYRNGEDYKDIGYGKPLSEVALEMIGRHLEKANDKFVITCLNIYKNAIVFAETIYNEVNNEKYNVLLKK
jgi:hypothetical protein